jgi:integrase
MNYSDCAEATYRFRWAGQKDGERTRERALRCASYLLSDELFTPEAVHRLRRDLLGLVKLSSASVNRHLAAYFGVWRHALQCGLVKDPPPAGMYLREGGRRTAVVALEQLDQLCQRMHRDHARLARFLYHTGCRVGEALNLTFGDADGAAGTITFKATKNGEDRTIPWPPGVDFAVFYGPSDRGPFWSISQSSFNRDWSEARDACGLNRELVPHSLRHGYATRIIAAGVPLAVAARLLGHRDIKTTMRYVHMDTQNCVDALKKAGVF